MLGRRMINLAGEIGVLVVLYAMVMAYAVVTFMFYGNKGDFNWFKPKRSQAAKTDSPR